MWLTNANHVPLVRPVVGQEQVTAAADTAEEQTEASVQEVEGVFVGLGNFVVDETGAILSPSKLTVHQMRVELMMRGLLVDGRRKDLYKRIQARIWPGCRARLMSAQREIRTLPSVQFCPRDH